MKQKLTRLSFLALGHLVNDLYPGMLSPLLPILIARNGWTLAYAGVLVSVLQISCNLPQPAIAIFNDHRPTRTMLWISLLIAGLPFCFILMSSSLPVVIALLIISGTGVSMFHPTAAAASGRTAAGNRSGLLMAIFSAGGLIGFSIAPMAAVLVVEIMGSHYMPVVIVPALLMSLYFALDRSIPVPASHGYSRQQWFNAIGRNFRQLFLLWIISGLRSITHMLLAAFIPMLIMNRGVNYAGSASWLTISLFWSMLGMLAGGHLSDMFGKKRMIGISLFVTTPFLYAFLYTSGPLSLVFLSIGMASLSSTIPVGIIMAQEAAPSLAGTASSMVMGMSVVLGALAASPFGILSDHIGIETAMNIPLALPALGVLFVLLLKNE